VTQITFPATGCNENRAIAYVKVAATVFDYGALAPNVARALRQQAARIRQRSTAVAVAVIETGHDLLAVQQQLKDRRQFCEWVIAECGFSRSSAYNYINASRLTDQFPTVGHLHPRTLYKLGAKSTPPEIVEEVVARASGGAAVPYVDVARMLDEARFQKRETDRKRREKERRARMPKRRREELEAREAAAEKERSQLNNAAEAVARKLVSRFGPECVAYLQGVRRDLHRALDVLAADEDRSTELVAWPIGATSSSERGADDIS
jgi:hypothetical protein